MKFQVLVKRTTVQTHIPCIQDIAVWVGITKTLSFPTLCCEGTRGRERQVAITPTNATKNLMPTHLGRIQRGKHHKLYCGRGKKKKSNKPEKRRASSCDGEQGSARSRARGQIINIFGRTHQVAHSDWRARNQPSAKCKHMG